MQMKPDRTHTAAVLMQVYQSETRCIEFYGNFKNVNITDEPKLNNPTLIQNGIWGVFTC